MMSSITPPFSLQSALYCACPSLHLERSLVTTPCAASSARGPSSVTSPMCETSKMPTSERTAACSSRTPLYCTGMSKPATSTMRAPASRCASYRGVRRATVPPERAANLDRSERGCKRDRSRPCASSIALPWSRAPPAEWVAPSRWRSRAKAATWWSLPRPPIRTRGFPEPSTPPPRRCASAGGIHLADVADFAPGRFDLVFEVNVRGAFLCSRAVIPAMRERGFGRIVMMSPRVSVAKVAGKAPYMISKMGMTVLAHAIAEEEREHGIAAAALWPVTLIESEATRFFGMGTAAQWRSPDILADATVAICCADPGRVSGRALYDEEALRELSGVTDFSAYSAVAGTTPAPFCREMIE